MAWLKPGATDKAVTRIVEKERWTQTVIYEEIPEEPIGVFVVPQLEDDVNLLWTIPIRVKLLLCKVLYGYRNHFQRS